MIRNFADKETERLANGVRSRKLPPEIQDKAVRLLREMGRVRDWNDLRYPEARLSDVITGSRRIDAELDLRLARYFRMSPGFFLGLQIDYELLEARRSLNGALDRIVPRAA